VTIAEATRLIWDEPDWFIKHRARRDTVYVWAKAIYRSVDDDRDIVLDARDVMSDDWYVVDGEGEPLKTIQTIC
jgi:hypothetical protein